MFKNKIEELHTKSNTTGENIPIAIMALNTIYDSLTEREQRYNDNAFMIVLNNLITK